MSGYEAWFDGACWPNPGGHSACGAVVKRDGLVIYEGADYLGAGQTSNNSAEYGGLILALSFLLENNITEATIYGDSDLVIKQITGRWKVKRKRRPFYLFNYDLARQLADKLPNLKYKWIPRLQNTHADFLSTKPLRDRNLRPSYNSSPVFRATEELDDLFEAALARSN